MIALLLAAEILSITNRSDIPGHEVTKIVWVSSVDTGMVWQVSTDLSNWQDVGPSNTVGQWKLRGGTNIDEFLCTTNYIRVWRLRKFP